MFRPIPTRCSLRDCSLPRKCEPDPLVKRAKAAVVVRHEAVIPLTVDELHVIGCSQVNNSGYRHLQFLLCRIRFMSAHVLGRVVQVVRLTIEAQSAPKFRPDEMERTRAKRDVLRALPGGDLSRHGWPETMQSTLRALRPDRPAGHARGPRPCRHAP